MFMSSPNEAPLVRPFSCLPLRVKTPAVGALTDEIVGRKLAAGAPSGVYRRNFGVSASTVNTVGSGNGSWPTKTCPFGN